MTTYHVTNQNGRTCGHNHKSAEAAVKCGEKLYGSRYENGSWTANAEWHNYRVLDSDGRTLSADNEVDIIAARAGDVL